MLIMSLIWWKQGRWFWTLKSYKNKKRCWLTFNKNQWIKTKKLKLTEKKLGQKKQLNNQNQSLKSQKLYYLKLPKLLTS